MRTSCMLKKWTGIAMLAVGLCVTGCKPSPEQVAERTKLLFEAIKSNDVEAAKSYIKAGANVNAKKDDEGTTPLIYAIQKDRDEMVDLLIKSKVDVNAKDSKREWPPIVWVLCSKDWEKRTRMLDMLIKANADLNDGLSFVVERRRIDDIKFLTKSGANPNGKDSNGKTPLMYTYDMNIASILIELGADINAKDNDGNTALMRAAESTMSGA